MKHLLIPLAALHLLAACAQMGAAPALERPVDEVPQQVTLANGERQYGFGNGCTVVLHPTRAVVASEGPQCALHHRDIALLYASAD